MLPNHAPLVIAEQFGTLAALSPRPRRSRRRSGYRDRPTDRAGAAPRTLAGNVDALPPGRAGADRITSAPAEPNQPVRAIPGEGTKVPVWILGSSLYGAQLAAALGLPYAFASHFAPAEARRRWRMYRQQLPARRNISPSPMSCPASACSRPGPMRRPSWLFSSQQQAFVNLRTGAPGPLPPPVEGICGRASIAGLKAMLDNAFSCAVVGSAGDGEDGARRRSLNAPSPTS